MKIPFVGPSAQARSLNVRNERTVNCYLEVDQANPRAPIALYGTFGLQLFATLGTGPCRGSITSGDFGYFVSGNGVYRLNSAGAAALLGYITTYTGRVGIASNGSEVIIVDGVKGWLATDSALTEIVDVDFPDGVTVATCQDGFFVVAGDGSQKFYWNETPNVGSTWNGLDFASVEGSPDDVLGVITDHRELWFVGKDSTEVFVNTGNADQLFARSGTGIMPQGTVSAWTVQPFDNSVVWLSASKEGQGMVLKSQGGNPVRISDHALEEAISGYAVIDDAFAYVWQAKGHLWYVLTFPSADATWFFDAASGAWSEWSWRDPADNSDHRHRSNCYAFLFGRHLVGDWQSGKVYALEPEAYTDDGIAIRRRRRTQTLPAEGRKRLFFGQITLDMEPAVATDATPAPAVMLEYSNDDGRTWQSAGTAPLGRVGEYSTLVTFPPSGCTEQGRGRVWELTCTDPIAFVLYGADAEVVKGA